MKKVILILFVLANSILLSANSKPTIYVLVYGATNDASVGTQITSIFQNSLSNFKQIAAFEGANIVIETVKGADFTPTGILDGFSRIINKAKADTTGGTKIFIGFNINHGMNFTNTWSSLPFILANPNSNVYGGHQDVLSLQSLYESMIGIGVFDKVHIWGELCNDLATGVAPIRNHQSLSRKSLSNGKVLNLLKSANSLMASSSYGQYSYVYNFSTPLFKSLELVSNGTLSSKFKGRGGVFEYVKRQTPIISKRTFGKTQNPQCYTDLNLPKGSPTARSNDIKQGSGGNTPKYVSVNILDIIEPHARANTTSVVFDKNISGSAPRKVKGFSQK
jgi:hypothetical protein